MTLRTTRQMLIALTAAAGLSAGVARADYVNNFDAAPYSTNNGTSLSAIGNDNVTGTAWTVSAGGGTSAIASTANPFGGSGGHLRITDTSTANAVTARLNLASVLNLTNTFTVSFKTTDTSLAGGSNAIISFGEDSLFGNLNHWLQVSLATDTLNTVIVTYRTASLGGSALSFRAKQADGTSNFVYTDSSYFDVLAKINPTTYQYESLKINGVEQLGLGTIPATMYVPATVTPASAFRFYSGSATTGTIDIDNVSIAIPEPATLGLLTIGGLMMLSRQR
ncbi:MAG: PEP-CTERM sorting domain-containing protein [Phycisphaerales bacterium]